MNISFDYAKMVAHWRNNMFRKSLYSLGILMFVGVLITSRVHAGFVLRLTAYDLSNNQLAQTTIQDGGAGDLSGLAGSIVYVGPVGNWNLNVTSGLSQPYFQSSSTYAAMDLGTQSFSSGPGKLVIELTDTGFPAFPQNGFLQGVFTGSTTGGGTLSGDGYKSLTDQEFSYSNLVADVHAGPFSNMIASTVTDEHGAINSTYSMTLVTTIIHNTAGFTSTDYLLVNTVPVPAGVVMFAIGGGIIGVGEWLRRRRRVAVAM